MGYLFLSFSICFNIIANGFFKHASLQDPGKEKWMLFGVGLFIGLLNTLSYLKSLETLKLSIAYAVFGACSTIGVAIVSLIYFHEGLTVLKLVGLGVITVGLLMLWKG